MTKLSANTVNFLKVIYVLGLTAVLLLWLMQQSVNAYWVQTYHRPAPLAKLSQFSWWQQGGELYSIGKQKFNLVKAGINARLSVAEKVPTASSNVLTAVPEAIDKPIPDKLIPDKPAKQPPLAMLKLADSLPAAEQKSNQPAATEQQPAKTTPSQTPAVIKPSASAKPPKAQQQQASTPKQDEYEQKLQAMRSRTQRLYSRTEANAILKAEGKPLLPTVAKEPSRPEPTQKSSRPELIQKPSTAKKTQTKPDKTVVASRQKIASVDGTTPKKVLKSNLENSPKQAKLSPTLRLRRGDKVFFAGDSMMQGVAPHVKYTLSKKHGIKSINLSKQSTGLSYSSFFNWPKTVEQTLQKHPDIKLLVMFLGPNDPWAVPNPKGGKYIKFKSAQWESMYRSKIRRVLRAAKRRGVQVIWVGVPNMRKSKLNKGIHYLNGLYRSEAERAGIRYLPTNAIFGYSGSKYNKYAKNAKGKNVAIRTKDGIHFTRRGQKRIANKIISLLDIR